MSQLILKAMDATYFMLAVQCRYLVWWVFKGLIKYCMGIMYGVFVGTLTLNIYVLLDRI